jgi:plasmid stabilization system protein ParE
VKVVVSERALRSAMRASAWWKKYRLANTTLFDDEFELSLHILSLTPLVGSVATGLRSKEFRRIAMPKTHFYIYFRVEADCVRVVQVWHQSRKAPRI